jgi:hypothetical protein
MAGCLLACGAQALGGAAPVVGEEWITDVTASSATLQARIDPEGAETTYRFEYGTSLAYGTSIPIAGGSAGAGTSVLVVQAHPQDLQPETVYHFRVTATSSSGTGEGSDGTFVTQAPASPFALPDGRQYEMVSPPSKHGAEVESLHIAYNSGEGAAVQAAEDGGALTYLANAPLVANPPGSAGATQVLSTRGADGWSSQDIATPNEKAAGIGIGTGQEYRLFSPDLSLAVLQPLGRTPLSPEVPAEMKENELYLRDGDGGYRPLITKASNIAPNENRFVGASPDLGYLVFESAAALTPEAHELGNDSFAGNLYEWSAGGLKLVNVLPDGEPTLGAANLGRGSEMVRRAVSNDGSRVVWSTNEALLYSRDLLSGQTVQVDAAQGGPESGGGKFQIASADGTMVFFTDSGRLTSTSSNEDLYVFEVSTGRLIDLTANSVHAVQAVLGTSEDGSSVYVLAQSGLYLLHDTPSGWTTTPIAALSQEDLKGIAEGGSDLRSYNNRVSPNGRYLAFMSNRSLTGYDNLDASSGEPDEEVYLYDADSGRLVCASCNPTGARPVGEFDEGNGNGEGKNEPLMDPFGNWAGAWLAASLPGWTETELGQALYQPRYLSDSGRLFFGSSDALVANDTNGVEDVYQYQPAGVGDCRKPNGCVSLISAGTGSAASVFVDAGASGDDAFFLTHDRLAPQDVDGAFDVYDAHVCSASAPCFAPAPVVPPTCSTSDSCKPAPAPQPAIFGAPPSATFSGAGNLAAPAGKPAATRTGHRHRKRRQRPRRRRTRARRSAVGASSHSWTAAGERRRG